MVKNPLETELTLSDATILVRDIGQNEGGDGIPEGVEIEVVPEIQLGPKERRTVCLAVILRWESWFTFGRCRSLSLFVRLG